MARSMVTTTQGPLSSPRWAGDYLNRDHLIPGGFKLDPAAFNGFDAVVVDVGAAGAAAAAVAVPVNALTGPIPNGTVLWFSANKFIKLNAAAAAGAVSLTTLAIPTALVDADVTTYPGAENGVKYIPSGKIVGRTIAERDAASPMGPAADTDDEVYLVAFDIPDVVKLDDAELYRPNSVVYENFLPDWAAISAAVKAKVRDKYICSLGEA